MPSCTILWAFWPILMASLTAGSPALREANRWGMISAMSAAWSPIRSKSVMTFSVAETRRRSPATGCWRSSSSMQRCSMSCSISLTWLSSLMIWAAASASVVARASMAFSTASVTAWPISVRAWFSSARASS